MTQLRCGKFIIGLYGALTICQRRPHSTPHTVNDGIGRINPGIEE